MIYNGINPVSMAKRLAIHGISSFIICAIILFFKSLTVDVNALIAIGLCTVFFFCYTLFWAREYKLLRNMKWNQK